MGALSNLWNSEKGLFALALIVGSTVLAALGHMTIDQWIDFSKWIFGIYAVSKTVASGANAVATAITPAKTTVVSTPAGTIAESKPADVAKDAG